MDTAIVAQELMVVLNVDSVKVVLMVAMVVALDTAIIVMLIAIIAIHTAIIVTIIAIHVMMNVGQVIKRNLYIVLHFQLCSFHDHQ